MPVSEQTSDAGEASSLKLGCRQCGGIRAFHPA
jgi:hypothetical protein